MEKPATTGSDDVRDEKVGGGMSTRSPAAMPHNK
jgi:hypothetical protein